MSLKIGDKAPDFVTIDQNNREVKLSDYQGQKVLLYFYPKDNTPTCTTQACNIRDNFDAFKSKGIQVFGISVNGAKSHQNFIKKFDLPFDLLVDIDHEIQEKYGVWAEKTTFGKTYMGTLRTSFLIDENGHIEKIIDKVKSKEHSDQVLN
ncbi:thioredoxin-dependent thiol peroxidase [Marinilongibacter aquaticus]|uniref:thioredoxin-dependent thiol peroxidase n=1 Tax=Marinilongibacter aquaticus TaxID=2975157 RepID=UPI0021BD9891|nr:thioredoxin-dependent thiol peroxidase [Marinilongibacter aquaticus]UBM59373.1 thioredoxin-dependent thiol peroxidase [Marinilongibacter aquaticus]